VLTPQLTTELTPDLIHFIKWPNEHQICHRTSSQFTRALKTHLFSAARHRWDVLHKSSAE